MDESVYLLCLSPEKIRYLIRVVEGDLAVCEADELEHGGELEVRGRFQAMMDQQLGRGLLRDLRGFCV